MNRLTKVVIWAQLQRADHQTFMLVDGHPVDDAQQRSSFIAQASGISTRGRESAVQGQVAIGYRGWSTSELLIGAGEGSPGTIGILASRGATSVEASIKAYLHQIGVTMNEDLVLRSKNVATALGLASRSGCLGLLR